MVGSILLYPDMERPSLYFLKFFCSVLFDTTSRTVGRLNEPAPGSAHRESNPSEDLSELSPLRSVVAGQEYHCPRTRSLRGSLPKLLLDGWVPLVTLLGRLYAVSYTGGLRASSASLFHFWLIRLMSFQSLDMYFSSCMGRTENVPSLLVGIKSKVLIGSFQKFFNFFQNSVLSLAYRGLFDVHNLRDLTLCFSVLISQRQQEFLVGR